MSSPSLIGRAPRPSIERFADQAFSVARDRILREHAEKRNRVLAQARLTGNSGSYLPALVKWGAERVRDMILARADADVEAFTIHGVPSDARAETNLQTAARQIAAGTISAIRGELELRAKRTREHGDYPGGYLNREIEGAMKSALQEGVLGLRRQRITAENSLRLRPQLPMNHLPTAVNVGDSTKAAGGEEKRQMIELMRRIEKWRMTAGEDGGKLTQKQVTELLIMDLRAYSAAKEGKPRGKDHLGRIQRFAKERGLI